MKLKLCFLYLHLINENSLKVALDCCDNLRIHLLCQTKSTKNNLKKESLTS